MNIKSIALCAFAASMLAVSSYAQDQCKPIGWATWSGRTGGATAVTGGGNATPITVKTFADLLKYAKDSSPRVIYIDGTLGGGWSGNSGDRLVITAPNKTIIGLRAGTVLKAPIYISGNASNIIVRNIVINGPGSSPDQAWDNINIEGGAKNIWIDHCEFWDGQDGNADVVKGADNVTFTWCIFGYKKKSTHNLSNLIGSSDNEPVSEGKLNVTYMFNWWKAASQRKPRCRFGYVHVVNNLITGDAAVQAGTGVLGVSAGYNCSVLTENNQFIDEQNPIYTGNASGSAVNQAVGNSFTNCSGNTKGTGTAFTPPYEYKSFLLPASKVEAAVRANAGATLASPTACSVAGTSSSSVKSSSSVAKSSSSVASSSSTAKSSSSVAQSSASNKAPSVSFISPASSANLSAPATIIVEVNAADADGSVANVQLFLNGKLVRQENGSPYQWNDASQDTVLQKMPAGVYTLKAVATDNAGATGEASMPLTVAEGTSAVKIRTRVNLKATPVEQFDLLGRTKGKKIR